MRFAQSILCLVVLAGGCAAPAPPAATDPGASLLDTYWKAVEVDGKPVPAYPGTREPHVILRREGSRMTGFAGCNTLAGGFQQSGNTLRFGKLAMTRMACAGEAGNALEAAFTKALEDTASYRIAGDTLELRNAADTVRIRFTERPQP